MKFIKPLWPHQEQGLNEAIRVYEEVKALPGSEMQQTGYALFFEPRCGKTPTAINMLRYLCNAQKKRLKTIIFCPPRVVPGWKKEFAEHSKFLQDQIIMLPGGMPAARRLKLFKEGTEAGAHIFITNYETLLMSEMFQAFVEWKPEFLVFDEAHRLKDKKAKRSKRAEFLANPREATWDEKKGVFVMQRGGKRFSPPYKMLLTGSPILKSLEDLYWQFYILDGGDTFSYWDYRTHRNEPMSFQGFRMQYFVDRNAGMPKERYFPKWEIKTLERDGVDGLALITQKIKNKSMRVERKNVLTLPPNDTVTIEVEMSQEQKKLYREMKQEFITWYKSQAVVAKLALTKSLRLLQITSGFVKTETGEEIILEDVPKQDALRELLEDLLPSGKAVVWSVFRENYRQIKEVCEKLKVKYVEVNGNMSPKEQDENVLRFQTDPDVQVFIGHPESGGEGLNLSVARYIIFYSRGHSVKHWIQGWARNQSQDSKHETTTTYNIVARGTLDQLACERVTSTEKMAEEVYSELVVKNIFGDEKF